jgi:lipopolysaccharide biosynthesis glycosyltransferase
MKKAYATVLCNGDDYVPGVEALGRSIRKSGSREAMVLMVTPDVSSTTRETLAAEGWTIRDVEPVENPNPAKAQLFPRFAATFTKLRAWDLVEYDKVVLLDADTLVLQNVDDLFDRPGFAAAPDFLIPDRFNSGVMVLEPSRETFARMAEALASSSSYDGGDQGFLNTFFADWWAMPVAHRLPAGYNLFHFVYQFLRAHTHLQEELAREARIVHYAVQKPWKARATLTGGSEMWWHMYFGVHPEQESGLKDRLHAVEDWTFDRFVDVLLS